MTLASSLLLVASSCLIGNRLMAVAVGTMLKVPRLPLFMVVFCLDIVQIPLFYWVYEHAGLLARKLPFSLPLRLTERKVTHKLPRWGASLGGLGVCVIAAFPSFGGGMWSAVLVARQLRLSRPVSWILLCAGSFLGFCVVSGIIETVVDAAYIVKGKL